MLSQPDEEELGEEQQKIAAPPDFPIHYLTPGTVVYVRCGARADLVRWTAMEDVVTCSDCLDMLKGDHLVEASELEARYNDLRKKVTDLVRFLPFDGRDGLGRRAARDLEHERAGCCEKGHREMKQKRNYDMLADLCEQASLRGRPAARALFRTCARLFRELSIEQQLEEIGGLQVRIVDDIMEDPDAVLAKMKERGDDLATSRPCKVEPYCTHRAACQPRVETGKKLP